MQASQLELNRKKHVENPLKTCAKVKYISTLTTSIQQFRRSKLRIDIAMRITDELSTIQKHVFNIQFNHNESVITYPHNWLKKYNQQKFNTL